MIVRKEEAPPFASHRSIAHLASSAVKVIIFFFPEAADEEEEEERPRPLSSPGAEVGAETVLPASLRPRIPPLPPPPASAETLAEREESRGREAPFPKSVPKGLVVPIIGVAGEDGGDRRGGWEVRVESDNICLSN